MAPGTLSGPFSPLFPPQIAHYAARTEATFPPVNILVEFSFAVKSLSSEPMKGTG